MLSGGFGLPGNIFIGASKWIQARCTSAERRFPRDHTRALGSIHFIVRSAHCSRHGQQVGMCIVQARTQRARGITTRSAISCALWTQQHGFQLSDLGCEPGG